MRTKFYIETTHDGLQFIRLRRAMSNRHNPRDSCDERLCRRHTNCMHTSVEEWNGLVRLEQTYRREYEVLNRSLDRALSRAERERLEKIGLQHKIEMLQQDMNSMAVSIGENGRARKVWQERFKLAQKALDEKDVIIKDLKDQLAISSRLLARHNIAC